MADRKPSYEYRGRHGGDKGSRGRAGGRADRTGYEGRPDRREYPGRAGGRGPAEDAFHRADTERGSVRPQEPDENRIEGRNAVIEAYRAGRTIEKLFLLEGPAAGAMQTVLRLA